jgi:hypothetical protein
MRFSPAYQYLGVVFKTGFTILVDCDNQLKPMIKLEDHIGERLVRSKHFKGIYVYIFM